MAQAKIPQPHRIAGFSALSFADYKSLVALEDLAVERALILFFGEIRIAQSRRKFAEDERGGRFLRCARHPSAGWRPTPADPGASIYFQSKLAFYSK
jgi:hypothetical protein